MIVKEIQGDRILRIDKGTGEILSSRKATNKEMEKIETKNTSKIVVIEIKKDTGGKIRTVVDIPTGLSYTNCKKIGTVVKKLGFKPIYL